MTEKYRQKPANSIFSRRIFKLVQNAWVFILAISLYSLNAFGQGKVEPPPTKITIPSDTTKVKHEKEKKNQSGDSELNLPDVLILGKNRVVRTAAGKKNLNPESPTIVRPGHVYEPISIWFKRDTNKPELTEGLANLDRLTWARLQAGGYATLNVDAGHWRKINQGNVRIQGWLDRSNGQFHNSRYSRGGLAGKISYELAPSVTGTAHGKYALFRRGLHGATLDDFTRRSGSGNFGADLRYDVTKLSDGKLGFDIGGASVQSDTNSTRFDKTDDFWYKLYFGYTAQLAGIQITTSGNYVRDFFKLLADSVSTKSSLGEIGIEALSSISSAITAIVGVKYQSTSTDSFTTESRFSPHGRINFMPTNHIGLTTSFFTGQHFKTFTDWWKENPYISHAIPLRPDDIQFGFGLASDLEILPGVKLHGEVRRSWYNRFFYWEQNTDSRLINLNEIDKIELTELQIGVTAQLNDRTRLQISFISYSDKLDSTAAVSNLDRIPYRPDFRLPVRASIKLLQGMVLTLRADIYGPRRNHLNANSRLPGFALMHASLTKDFGKKFSAILTARNLLDSEYVIWENYPETGVNVLAGLRAKF